MLRRALACGLLALAALPAGADAAPAPWRSADTVEARLFDAQDSLLLDEPGGATSDATRARRAYGGRLARGLKADAPAQHAKILRALAAARRAAGARDEVGLARARGATGAALFAGSYQATIASVRAGDAGTAASWLLIRDFRRATRFTRPGIDATKAVRSLARDPGRRRSAELGVKKDLLDAYQARVADAIEKSREAARRGFRPRQAEQAALARGLWEVLAPEYERQRGAAARRTADASFRRFDGSAAAARGVEQALDGFTAAPFTAEEKARRAQQLLRFLELVPVDYDHGVEGGKVTIPFEIQESRAFIDASQAAFSDLEGDLEKMDPGRTERVAAALDRLDGWVADAESERAIAPPERLEATTTGALDLLEEEFPEEWKEADSQSDFDLIALSLDRMEAAVGAGEWEAAEQARLEAYAFFEFGPELTLKSVAPGLVAEVEGYVWFGENGKEGLAKLIAGKRPRREVHETRLAMDETLEEAAGTLGQGANGGEAVVNAAVIVFREGLEAVLILAAVMASMARGAARLQRRPMVVGVILALLASVLTFVLAQTVLTSLAQYGEKLEAVVGLVAIAVLLVVLNWFLHKVYWTQHISKFHKRRKHLLSREEAGFLSAQAIGFVLLGFSTVYREGFETVLFLQALELNSGIVVVLEGVALGLLAVGAVAVATFGLQRKLPYKRMLIVTGVLIGVVLLIMVGKTVRTLQGVGWFPITPLDFEVPFWAGSWFGVFPTVETLLSQLAAAVFVIGSYFLAERMRKAPRPATSPPSPPRTEYESAPARREAPQPPAPAPRG